jgi:hypothetical protein
MQTGGFSIKRRAKVVRKHGRSPPYKVIRVLYGN